MMGAARDMWRGVLRGTPPDTAPDGERNAGRCAPGIALHDLTVSYDGTPAVRRASGCFAPGSLTAVVGPNGAGKSSLVKAVAGVLAPASGRVDRGGMAARDFGYLPQAAEIDRSFPITVADTVLLGAWRRTGALGGVDRDTVRQAREAVALLGLQGLERRPVGSLSAGQFQRVLFARLVLQDAPVILLDEPFNALDARTTQDLLRLLRRWHGEGRTVVAVLHDMAQVRELFPDTLLIARDVIAWGPTAEVLTPANLRRARVTATAWDDLTPDLAPGLEPDAAYGMAPGLTPGPMPDPIPDLGPGPDTFAASCQAAPGP